MSFAISKVVLYSHFGESRILQFNSRGLNVITGDSKTGKSAIIDIIDYCLGRGSCNVAEGFIRKNASWFGLEIESPKGVLFIARKNPGPGTDVGSEIYVRRGRYEQVPQFKELTRNIAEIELVQLLTRFVGIAENQHRPQTGTRQPLEATIRHALFLCFQKQDEIDNRDRLFHRQGDQFIPQAIKDTLPYFVGSVDESHFLRQHELDTAKDILKNFELHKSRRADQSNSDFGRLRRLVNDAKRVGVVRQNFEPSNIEIAVEELSKASKIDIESADLLPDFGQNINRLRDEIATLRGAITFVTEEERAARLMFTEQSAFTREASEQRSRLRSIGLFKAKDVKGNACPVCESKLAVPTPTAANILQSLEHVSLQLNAVQVEQPHLQSHIEKIEAKKRKLENELVDAQAALSRAISEDERARAQNTLVIERARVVGRISSYFDNLLHDGSEDELDARIEAARKRVILLEGTLNADDASQRLDTYLNIISKQMSKYAERLDLEHSGSELRLDLKKLTVVADTEDGPIPLNRMGSGENWVGYHVLTYLSLHWWFQRRDRPVPRVIIFDQPSQAHYPVDRDQQGRIDVLQDKDRYAVQSLFELMYNACIDIGDLQIIVLDHAHLKDDWFEKSIVEEWREGKYLVPLHWQQ